MTTKPTPAPAAAHAEPTKDLSDQSYQEAWSDGETPDEEQQAALRRIAELRGKANEGMLERAAEYSQAYDEANAPEKAKA